MIMVTHEGVEAPAPQRREEEKYPDI